MTPPPDATAPAPGSAVAIVVAAGSGERLGRPLPKAFVELGGVPMLALSVRALGAASSVSGGVIVAPPGQEAQAAKIARRQAPGVPILAVVAGGRTRQESVRRGLEAVPEEAVVVLCHDAARPFASPALFDRVAAAVAGDAAGAVPVIRPADTVKRLLAGSVVETISRDEVGLAQTPQGFAAAPLREAHAHAARSGLEGTDDAMLLEAMGYRVIAVDGEASNFKITTEGDLRRAEVILGRMADPGPAWRSG